MTTYSNRINVIASSRSIPSLRLMITNTQNVSTPAGLQVLATVPLTFGNYSVDFDKIAFYYNGNPIYSWVESVSNLNMNVWLKMPVSIPANTSITINAMPNIKTVFDNNYWGCAPTLTNQYGQYDNGANVFSLYFNGNTPLSNFDSKGNTLTQVNIAGPTGATIKALSLSGYASYIGFIYIANSIPNQPIIAESSSKYAGSTANGQVSILSGTSTSTLNAISVDMGYSGTYFSMEYYINGSRSAGLNRVGTANTNWHYASVTYYGSSASSWYGYIAPQLYSTAGGYSGAQDNNPLSSSPNLYLGLIGGGMTSTMPWQTYINWMRARAYPPNGVMPSVTVSY